jgi:hypothetical protein
MNQALYAHMNNKRKMKKKISHCEQVVGKSSFSSFKKKNFFSKAT